MTIVVKSPKAVEEVGYEPARAQRAHGRHAARGSVGAESGQGTIGGWRGALEQRRASLFTEGPTHCGGGARQCRPPSEREGQCGIFLRESREGARC